jgi:hypothetical protein
VGDRGFDPLRLGQGSAERLAWFAEAEKTNGRWAMAAVAGILFTDLVGLPKWWQVLDQVRSMAACRRSRSWALLPWRVV